MKKYLKRVDKTTFDYLSEGCPVEVKCAEVYSDIESEKLFLSVCFCNVSGRDIASLDFLMSLYDSKKANLPYLKQKLTIDLSEHPDGFYISGEDFSHTGDTAENGAEFGRDHMISLPESYFKRLDVQVLSIVYSNGSEQVISSYEVSDARNFDELDPLSRMAYDKVNIYKKTEEQFPAICVPERSSTAWICCCGEKNIITDAVCKRCHRDRDWLFTHIAEGNLEKKALEMADMKRPENAYFAREKRQRAIVSEKEREERLELFREADRARANVARQQRAAERRKKRLLNILAIWLIICAIFVVFSVMK